ncbi:type IV secretion protein Rhs, partial [Pseudomonas fluorescens]
MIPVMGKFVLSPMNAKAPDVEGVLRDFRACLNTFDDWAESFWSGSALEVEQVFKVGEEVALIAPGSSRKPSAVVATCDAQGSMTLVHLFESTRFVPIGNTPVMLQAIASNGSPVGTPIHRTIDSSGILEIQECTRDQKYQITFYPNVSKDHVKVLYASYQSVIAGLEAGLRDEWAKTFKPQWDDFANATSWERSAMQGVAFASGLAQALYNLWDNVTQLYELLSDLKANSEKLLAYISQAELEELLKLGKDAIASGLLVLSDEPLLFIYLSAMVSWIRLLPPP